tara:strand:+ start:36 stop:854 length:819 start_codon:yes stop_codon:yes gene_type:complete
MYLFLGRQLSTQSSLVNEVETFDIGSYAYKKMMMQIDDTNMNKIEENSLKDSILETLLSYEVHVGLSKKDVHQNMVKYIRGYRNNLAIYDINILLQIYRIMFYSLSLSASEGPILFITKNKFLNYKIQQLARKYDHYYMTGKWINGFLTNFHEMKTNIMNVYGTKLKRRKRVLFNTLGISSMGTLPSMIVLIGLQGNRVMLREANQMRIPVIGFSSARENGKNLWQCIPSNLNSEKSLYFYYYLLKIAIEKGHELKKSNLVKENESVQKDKS